MRLTNERIFKSFGVAAMAVLAVVPALAGSMDLEWSPAEGDDVAGYRIYIGSQPGVLGYAADVANVDETSLNNLNGCSYYYVAVKARDSQGLVSDDYSNLVEGYPHPDIVSVSPAAIGRGATATIVVSGGSFVAGAVPSFGDHRLSVRSSHVDSCGRMTLEVAVAKNASDGPAALTITNPDGGFATSAAALRLVSEGTGVPLQVLSVTPAPGAGSVDPMASVRVHFSATVDPATIGAGRFKIEKSGGRGSARLTGVPTVDTTGTWVTLGLASPLQSGASYDVVVKGGHSGVHDVDGNPIDADYVQNPAFTTTALIQDVRFGPAEQVAGSGTTLTDGATVPAVSAFVVRFSEPMSASTLTAKTLRIRKSAKGKVQLVDGQPLLLADGVTVLMVPAEPLEAAGAFVITVKGGPKGVASARGVVMAEERELTFTTALAVVSGLGVAE